ncbi:MAG: hypothetical protein KZQ95_06115 [Candidatus Thiodiazotropha sp. (ex Epidulcina cf. delphinae)]|nr:hypothetical protein [Candidatus Thiodiazotropha sp. (ex Epidulcina cf. delphinae)]
MDHDQLLVGLSFFCYLLVILIIGVTAWRRTRNLSDHVTRTRGKDSRLGPSRWTSLPAWRHWCPSQG